MRAEKARLEAFLSAVPGEYCGWGSDGTVAYSKGFCDALGLSFIETFQDVKGCLMPEDAVGLDALFAGLVQDGLPFTMNVETRYFANGEQRTCKISGTRGTDLAGQDYFNILWLEDITGMKFASAVMEEERLRTEKELAQMQEVLDAMHYPVWIRDASQKIIWCNVAYAKMVKSSPGEIIAEQKEIIPKDRERKPKEAEMKFGSDLAQAALNSGSEQMIEIYENIAGRRVFLKITERPVVRSRMTIGIAEDLTAHQEAADALRNHLDANRSLMEYLRSAIAIYDQDYSLSFYNSSFSQLWDLEEGWLNTKPKLGDIMEKLRETRRLPEQADFKSYKKSWLAMFTDLIEPYEDMLYLPDGSALRMLVVARKMGGLMMTFEDVTSRLALESSYNTLIAVQKETLDNLEEGVVVYGGDGRLKLWNPSFADLWGFNPETLEGEPHITKIVNKVSSYFNETGWIEIRDQMISLALDRRENEGRFERLDKSLIDYSTVPLPDGGVLITYTDVTDTVRVEYALREKNEALETAEKLKLDFLANVSYQLRTPLNAIMGFNEMLTQELFGPLNEKQKEYTGDIQGASERLLSLINNILDLSTIEAGQMSLDMESVSIKALMESVLDLVADWARKDHIEVSLVCPTTIGKADIDGSRVRQALVNLVRNSVAHTPEGGEVILQAKRHGNDILLSVIDNGAGIAKEHQGRVFQPFERVENARVQDRGAGLGLALVRHIVNLHGGSLELESQTGVGTKVTLALPIHSSRQEKA